MTVAEEVTFDTIQRKRGNYIVIAPSWLDARRPARPEPTPEKPFIVGCTRCGGVTTRDRDEGYSHCDQHAAPVSR